MAETEYSTRIYLFEGESFTLDLPAGVTEIESDNPAVLEINGNKITAAQPGTTTVYYWDKDDWAQKICDVVIAGDKLEVLIIGPISGENNEFVNYTSTGYLNTDFMNLMDLSAYDIVFIPILNKAAFWNSDLSYLNFIDAHENGIPLFTSQQIQPAADPSVAPAYIPDFFDISFIAGWNDYNFISENISDEVLSQILETYYDSDFTSDSLTPLYAQAALEKMIKKADSIGYSGSELTQAKSVLNQEDISVLDCISALHNLKQALYNEAAVDGITSIQFKDDTIQRKIGSVEALKPMVFTQMGLSRVSPALEWSSDNNAVAEPDDFGIVDLKASGTAEIIAKFSDSVSGTIKIKSGPYFTIFAPKENVSRNVPEMFVYDDSKFYDCDLIGGTATSSRNAFISSSTQYDAFYLFLIASSDSSFLPDLQKSIRETGAVNINHNLPSLISAEHKKNYSHQFVWGEGLYNFLMDENQPYFNPADYKEDLSDVPPEQSFGKFWYSYLKNRPFNDMDQPSFYYSDLFDALIESGELEKEALRNSVYVFSKLDENDYTADSWNQFNEKMTAAQSVIDKFHADSETVDSLEIVSVLYDLKEAYRLLVPAEVFDDEIEIDELMDWPVNSWYKIEIDPKINNQNFVWTSDDESVATVDKNGVVRTHKQGYAFIEGTSDQYPDVSVLHDLYVYPPVAYVSLSDSRISATYGEVSSLTLDYTIRPFNSDNMIGWKSSNTNVVSVSNGKLTFKAPGTAKITATVTDLTSSSKFEMTCNVVVKVPKDQRINILYVGSSELKGAELAVNDMYYGGYYDFVYVSGYEMNTTAINPALLKMASDGEFSNYDVIFFDMFGEYKDIEGALKAAQASENKTKLISMENYVHPPEYFNKSFAEKEDQDKSALYKFYTQSMVVSDKTASLIWGDRFLIEAASFIDQDRLNAKQIPDELQKEIKGLRKIEVLYIGDQTTNLTQYLKIYENSVYGGFLNFTIEPSFNTTMGDGQTQADLEQITHLNKILNEKKYDYLILDGFYFKVSDNPLRSDLSHEYSHASYLSIPTDKFGIVIYPKSDGTPSFGIGSKIMSGPMLNFPTEVNEGVRNINFGVDADGSERSMRFLHYILKQSTGNSFKIVESKRITSWEYTKYFAAQSNIGYYHLNAEGQRIHFDELDNYMSWYKTNGYNSENPTVGIWMFLSDIGSGTDDLIRALESQNVNVIVGYETYDNIPDYYTWTDPNTGELRQIDAAVSIKNFGLNYWNYYEGIRQLETMDISVIKGIFSTYNVKDHGSDVISDRNSMIQSSGLSRMTLSPNRDGIFDFIVLGHMNRGSVGYPEQIEWAAERAAAWAHLKQKDNADKDIALLYYNYPPGKADIGANYMDVITSFTGASNQDGLLENMRKTGSYSVYNRTLGENVDLGGYNIDYNKLPYAAESSTPGKYDYVYKTDQSDDEWRKKVLTEENLRRLMWSQGINVGSHAPGVLKTMVQDYIDYLEAGNNPKDWWGCRLMPVDDYKIWLDEGALPQELSDELNKTWGTPWTGELSKDQSGMIWEDTDGILGNGNPAYRGMRYFVFPCIQTGDVWIMPQPDRALASTQAIEGDLGSVSSVDYHGDMAPTHQYVAFYLWLNKGLDKDDIWNIQNKDWTPDAVIHFGTHGTQEWLPGTAVGLQKDMDWGPNLIGKLPNIYPYIVANVGEGLTAEMRGDALIIDHLTPPLVRSGLYGEVLELESAIQSYTKHVAYGGGTELSAAYRQVIIDDYLFKIESVYAAMDFSKYNESISKDLSKAESDAKKAGKSAVEIEAAKRVVLASYMKGLNDDEFTAFIKNQVHNYLDSVMESAIPLGMHIYGQSPTDEQAASMVRSMWGNFRFEEIIKEVYFNGDIIPSEVVYMYDKTGKEVIGTYYNGKCDKDVDEFVVAYVRAKEAGGKTDHQIINDALDATLGGTADQRQFIELFIRGPIMYYDLGCEQYPEDDTKMRSYLKDAWKKNFSQVSGVSDKWADSGIYDISFMVFHKGGLEAAQALSDDDLLSYEDRFDKFVDEVVDILKASDDSKSLYYGYTAEQATDKALTIHYNVNNYQEQTWINQDSIDFVTGSGRDRYADNLKACGNAETQSLLSALSGGYISPTSGNDPIQNPSVLPTGRNFYGIDPDTYPTPAAWKVGKAMGEQMLASYYEEFDEFPETVSFMRFGVEYIRDEGALEACIYYLLGCEPQWSGNQYTGTGTFKGGKIVNYSDYKSDDENIFIVTLSDGTQKVRPRIDIVYNTAGMRDGFPKALLYIDQAIKNVYNHTDPASDVNKGVKNNIKTNTDDIYKILQKVNKDENLGLSDDDLKKLAQARTFAQQLGTYEIGTGNLISSSGMWNDETSQQDIADLYLSKMGYVYNNDFWGGDDANSLAMKRAMQESLKQMLARTDASLFASSSNLYDSLDNDDVFQYYGVMNMVSKQYGGKLPKMYMADTSNIDNFKAGDKVISTMQEALMKDMASRYLNPKWIEAMEAAGYSGSTMFAEFIENLYGWAVATDGELVSNELWSEVLKTYVESGRLEGKEAFSYSYQSMTARMMEAIRTGYWDATDAQKQQLAEAYVKSVLENGVACCHHSCGNPALDSFVAGQMAVLGLTPDQEEKYWEIVKQATERDKPQLETKSSSSSSGSGYGTATAVEAGDPADGEGSDEGEENPEQGESAGVGTDGDVSGTPVNEVNGFEMTVTKAVNSVRDFIQNPTFSTSSIIAIAFVVIIVGAIFYGSRRRNI
ncbi:cobaltochelatase subunit CobN [Methanimicrococcus sp. OttesenSCG-928-J09]|nr:cobaltochelatase subunit CobN [Methanimicrococcus sp. OttesenSCG-928-J09]